MVTAYDYPSAKQAEAAEIDTILVGDSLGMTVLGYDSTVQVTLNDMIHHGKAVCRAAKRAFVVIDMPFMSYQVSTEKALENAGRIIKETGAQAVKLEGGNEILDCVKKMLSSGIPLASMPLVICASSRYVPSVAVVLFSAATTTNFTVASGSSRSSTKYCT